MYNSVQLIDCTFFAVSHSPFTFFHALRDCQLGPRGLYISFIFWMTSNFQVIFLNYECFFPYWTLNWSFPFLLLWIYIYIGFKSCLSCFPEDWCVFSAFPCVPIGKFRPGRCSSGAIDGPGRCFWWWLWLSIAGLGGSDLAPWRNRGFRLVMGLAGLPQ